MPKQKKRKIGDGSWLWIHKAPLVILREHYDSNPKKTTSALAVMLVMTELASNYGNAEFYATLSDIASRSGLTRQTVALFLDEFEHLGLINIKKRKSGKANLPSQFTICGVDEGVVKSTETPFVHNKEKKEKKEIKTKKRNKVDTEYSEEFLQFWNQYPKKQDKKSAWRAFLNLDFDDGLFQKLLKKLEEWKKSGQWHSEGGKFIPMPSTWINKRRWEDEDILEFKEEINDEAQFYVPGRVIED
jgi:hypothetical protein